MAYLETTPSRLGQSNLTGGSYANDNTLFLKQFAGEVLTTFETENVMMPLHVTRSISSGKSAQFPTTGIAAAGYHTPGESLMTTSGSSTSTSKYLSRIPHAEVVISIDDMLVSSAFIANIDEAKNHYDVRSIYSTEIGRQLAYTADKNLMRCVVAGARATTNRFGATGTSPYLGAQITWNDEADTAADKAASLVTALFSAAQKMDEKSVPSSDRYAVLTPALYYTLVNGEKDAISRDFNPEVNGSKAGGYIVSVAGIKILKSNNLPTTDESSATNVHNNGGVANDVFGSSGVGYGGISFANTYGIIFQREAVGTVKLMDLGVESDYSIERQGTLLVAKYAMGHGVLRNECCYELVGDA
jgi:hypothetical protein